MMNGALQRYITKFRQRTDSRPEMLNVILIYSKSYTFYKNTTTFTIDAVDIIYMYVLVYI